MHLVRTLLKSSLHAAQPSRERPWMEASWPLQGRVSEVGALTDNHQQQPLLINGLFAIVVKPSLRFIHATDPTGTGIVAQVIQRPGFHTELALRPPQTFEKIPILSQNDIEHISAVDTHVRSSKGFLPVDK